PKPTLVEKAKLAPQSVTGIVAIAGSTGAPGVIADILSDTAASLRCPVLVVQHLTESFVGGFAIWLRQRTGLPVYVGEQGLQTEAGGVYLAPDHAHLGINRHGRIELDAGPAEEGFRPCANYLFRSVARSFGGAALGVLLTGMGRDGAAGLLELRKVG